MKVIILGSSGFIGCNLVAWHRRQGDQVIGVDRNVPEAWKPQPDQYLFADLSNQNSFNHSIDLALINSCDRIYQLAADMGGAKYIFTGENDFNIATMNAAININTAKAVVAANYKGDVFYSSSACIYPQEIQENSNFDVKLGEWMAYPANPDSVYGWEKLYSEIMWDSTRRNHGINVYIARFHNIYGEFTDYKTDRAKAPAAMCYKAFTCRSNGNAFPIIGDGEQRRSFLYISDCINGIDALIKSGHKEVTNIGSEEGVSINDLAKIAVACNPDAITPNYVHIPGPEGVRSRNSHNKKMELVTGWRQEVSLREGMGKLYRWMVEMEITEGNK